MLGTSILWDGEHHIAVPRRRRVTARRSHSVWWVVAFAQIELGVVANLLRDQPYDLRERILEIETGRHDLPEPGERALLAL